MSFTNFYLNNGLSGASDVNAGSTQTGAAAYTSTSGNWSTVTNQFTPTDGSTPTSSISVGDYVSIYINAATVTTFVAQVTVVAAGVNGAITVSSTIIYGTAPTTNSGARSLKAGGTWNSEILLAATGLGTFTIPQSTKINFKGNITIAASRTISCNGSATNTLWFSGYNTTPGDLDADTTNALPKPTWTFNSTFNLTFSGVQLWSSINLVGNANSGLLTVSNSAIRLVRLRANNTSSGTSARCVNMAANGPTFAYCWFQCPATATLFGIVDGSNDCLFEGCTFRGGGLAGLTPSGVSNRIIECNFIGCVSGIQTTTGTVIADRCTFYNCTDAIKWTSTPGTRNSIVSCMFSTCTNGINNASGTNTTSVFRSNNDYYNVTNTEVGMGDYPAFFGQTESSDPLTSASNLTPVAGSNAINNGFPGIFENESFSSYPAIGAVQPLASGGASVAIFGS